MREGWWGYRQHCHLCGLYKAPLLYCMGVYLGITHGRKNTGKGLFENRETRKIFDTKRKKLTARKIQLLRQELNNFLTDTISFIGL